MKLLFALLLCAVSARAFAADWSVKPGKNPEGPGEAVDVLHHGKPVARFIHGDGQMKPYLHVFGADGELLTNSGLDRNGKPAGLFPHHRGIYIGWNKIASELGSDDLWHMTKGCRMEVQNIDTQSDAKGATLTARIGWHSAKKDGTGSDLLLTEIRQLVISRPEAKRTQVDAAFKLTPARDLTLDGDLQHAGIHFRASTVITNRKAETVYLWEPDVPGPGGKAVSKEFKWCRLIFPLNDQWYEVVQLNAPENPVEELSWRDYGRFGFFFPKKLAKGDDLNVRYRFIIQPNTGPDQRKPEQAKAFCQQQYEAFAKTRP